ncbi:concanavalin A-like lectin/glucanase superfamily protein [Paenibacillus cellulosilyticus]|uniref:Concanavalin A-like lectin/glucanase superfamily protein n=1 Tax=Paenibacillus cellulosilyticus TaxID=375489 RepID=A0A2V2YSU6_9BACL|nr:LamG domain-containing protein [Paenibacillus cellulosilyticus]PWW02453.1 concanavalin A-like lectin/glucanase superfamily protein [Paenibacillus cellulosilyticus]QKS47162.1 LamG domain-containing protein [Paenibacillus cellulosilyticus]
MNHLREGLAVEYLFDGGSEDTSGQGQHGRIEGAALTVNRFGEADRAYAFSGQGDHIVLDPPAALNPEAFSVSVWVKYDQNAARKGWSNAIISQDDHGLEADKSRRVFQLSTKGDRLVWHRMGRGRDAFGKYPIQVGVWYHVVACFDGCEHKLYVNGELNDSQAGTFKPNADEPIYIGKKNSNEPRFWFNGAIDDIRIYNRALLEQEISELYAEHGYEGDPNLIPVPQGAPRKKWSARKKGAVRKLLERQAFNWNDCYNSLALAVYGAMQYSNKSISLPQALVYTGQAFVINTDEKQIVPMNVFGDGSLLRAALDNLGYDMDVLAGNIYGGDWTDNTIETALLMVGESIQRGCAAIGWNLDNYEHGLIYGFDDKRQILNIHDINAREGDELAYDDFGKRPLNGEPINPEMFVLVLKDREERPHLSATRYTEEEDVSYRRTLCTALSLAIRHIKNEGMEDSSRCNGIAAIDAWIEAFESGSARPFDTSYNLLWITSSRQYLAPFFMQSAITHCMSIQDITLQQFMLKAAEVYMSSYRAWVGLRELFPFPHGADTTNPQLKAQAIRLLHDAREAEVSGLAVLHEIVNHLSSAAQSQSEQNVLV